MSEGDATTADLHKQIGVLKMDRDYWRDQHDLVMEDWRADVRAWATERAEAAARPDACAPALADLLRFFDPATGAVAARRGHKFLSDAFAKAYRLHGGDIGAEPSEASPGQTVVI